MKRSISFLRAQEILDSRGNPTLEVELGLADGTVGSAQVPSGASTGRHEAVELRDGDSRYAGKGVLKAAANVESEIARAVTGLNAEDQTALDRLLIELDGQPGKSRLGANAILGVSCAAARTVAISRGQPLWKRLSELGSQPRQARLPVPMVNILSGGAHAGRNIEMQDFLALPHGFPCYGDALHSVVAIHQATRSIIEDRGQHARLVADEGGWGPRLKSNEEALEILTAAIERAGFRPMEEVAIAIDVAASQFHHLDGYHLGGSVLDSDALIEMLEQWRARYPIISLEDGLSQDDWDGWRQFTTRLGSIQLIGDDFLTTNPARVRQAIARQAANAVLVKMNQIGTLSETFEVLDLAAAAGWNAVVSARSGETEDSFLADLAVASGAGQIKVGSITRSERLAKYNRLLWLERDNPALPYGPVAGFRV